MNGRKPSSNYQRKYPSASIFTCVATKMDSPLALSSADFQKRLNVSDSSYRRAGEDLLAAGYLVMRNGKKNTMDFYTSPQPTTYVKPERKKKPTTGGGAASAEPVSIEEAPCEPPAYEEPPRSTYRSSSPYGWEEN